MKCSSLPEPDFRRTPTTSFDREPFGGDLSTRAAFLFDAPAPRFRHIKPSCQLVSPASVITSREYLLPQTREYARVSESVFVDAPIT